MVGIKAFLNVFQYHGSQVWNDILYSYNPVLLVKQFDPDAECFSEIMPE